MAALHGNQYFSSAILPGVADSNVETVRAFLETWSREPWTLQAWQRGEVMDASYFDSDVVYEDSVLPDHVGELFRGHDGVLRAVESWLAAAEWVQVELEQIIDAGERVVSIHKARGKALHTGIEIETPMAYVWSLQDGKVVHFRAFADAEEALSAAGLRQ